VGLRIWLNNVSLYHLKHALSNITIPESIGERAGKIEKGLTEFANISNFHMWAVTTQTWECEAAGTDMTKTVGKKYGLDELLTV